MGAQSWCFWAGEGVLRIWVGTALSAFRCPLKDL